MTMLKLRIYDNGGKTVDRYTMILPDGEAWGFSENPYHPQGFGQYAGNLSDLRAFSHLGKPVKSIRDLPEGASRFVNEIATADGDTYVVETAAKPFGGTKPRKSTKRRSTRSVPSGMQGIGR